MAKQILRMETIKNLNRMAGKWRHNYRIGNVINADPEKRNLNHQLVAIPQGYNYSTFYQKRIEDLPYYKTHKPRKNGVIGIELMLSYGNKKMPEEYKEDPEAWMKKWEQKNREFLINEFGKENIASAVVHMDEGVPHIHAIVIPVKDGKVSARKIFQNRQDLSDLHARYYNDYMKECGLEQENRYVRIEHQKIGSFYGQVDKAMENSLPEPMEGEELDEYVVRANEFYKEQTVRSFSKDNMIQNLTTANEALEKANHILEEQTKEDMLSRFKKKVEREIVSFEYAKQAIAYMENTERVINEVAKYNPQIKESYDQIMDVIYDYYNQIERQEMGQEADSGR